MLKGVQATVRRTEVGLGGLDVLVNSAGVASPVALCASKAGVLGVTKALAVEPAPTVRVNAVCPGPVETPMPAAEFGCHSQPDYGLST